MKILIIGDEKQQEELKTKFGDNHIYFTVGSIEEGDEFVNEVDLVFDFYLEENPDNWDWYEHVGDKPIFVNITKTSLHEQAYISGSKQSVFGFNGLPTFINREVLEVSVFGKNDEPALRTTCEKLGTNFALVDDRVGMVTPRIICMIINEAYFTVQEGTAGKEDINQGMKLGTNYPYGPFEWCNLIGIQHVYELLEAVYEDTKDERYKICPLLKKEYLEGS